MRILSESIIRHPLARVYAAYRDELPEIAAYMPDIRDIQAVSREDEGDTTRLHNVWRAKREIPSFAKSILKPDMLQWDDHALWNGSDHTCDWRLELRVFTDAVKCGGTNVFEALSPDTTRVVLDGDLAINLTHVPGVPRILARRIAPKIEQFIVALITPNLKQVNRSLGDYLDAKG
jgi:hypothetical protein